MESIFAFETCFTRLNVGLTRVVLLPHLIRRSKFVSKILLHGKDKMNKIYFIFYPLVFLTNLAGPYGLLSETSLLTNLVKCKIRSSYIMSVCTGDPRYMQSFYLQFCTYAIQK